MPDWKADYAARNWASIETWWRHCDDTDELRELLAWLERDVPKITITDRMEEQQEFIHPKDATEEWRGAAEILQLGELKATVEGDPPSELEQWSETASRTTEVMRGFLADTADQKRTGNSKTRGNPLSRSAHAKEALYFLSLIDRDRKLMCAEIDPDGDTPEDRDWLSAVIAQAALAAFNAGVHAQIAIGKDIEKYALTGKLVQQGAASGGHMRSSAVKHEKDRMRAEMERLISVGYSIRMASQLAKENGHGTSAAANRKAFYRDLKKKT